MSGEPDGPRRAGFRANTHARPGNGFGNTAEEPLRIFRVVQKKPPLQFDLGRRFKAEPRDRRARAVGQRTSPALQDRAHLFIPLGCRLENHRSELGDRHLVGFLGPTHQFLQTVEREGAKDVLAGLRHAARQVIRPQNMPKRLDGEMITAADIAKELAPPPGFFVMPGAPPSNRGAGAGDHRHAVIAPKRGGEARFPVASHHRFRLRPDPLHASPEPLAICLRRTSGQEHAHMGRLGGQDAKKLFQEPVAHEAQIGCREHPAAHRYAGFVHIKPFRLGSATFDPQDTFHRFELPRQSAPKRGWRQL